MRERVCHIIIYQSPLPVTKQDFRIKSLSTVCFPRQFKTWVSYKSCITRPIVTSWLERSPCFRYDMFGAGLEKPMKMHMYVAEVSAKIANDIPKNVKKQIILFHSKV